MTGTGREVAREIRSVYGLDVVRVPLHRPSQRRHAPDMVCATHAEKWEAVAGAVARVAVAQGRPVLIGTRSVGASEEISAVLQGRGIAHALLNAKQDEAEAEIVAQAGQPGHEGRPACHPDGVPRIAPHRPPALRTLRAAGRSGELPGDRLAGGRHLRRLRAASGGIAAAAAAGRGDAAPRRLSRPAAPRPAFGRAARGRAAHGQSAARPPPRPDAGLLRAGGMSASVTLLDAAEAQFSRAETLRLLGRHAEAAAAA